MQDVCINRKVDCPFAEFGCKDQVRKVKCKGVLENIDMRNALPPQASISSIQILNFSLSENKSYVSENYGSTLFGEQITFPRTDREFSFIKRLGCRFSIRFLLKWLLFYISSIFLESFGPYFIWSVLQNCGPNILPYGPHRWLIRACDGTLHQLETVSFDVR